MQNFSRALVVFGMTLILSQLASAQSGACADAECARQILNKGLAQSATDTHKGAFTPPSFEASMEVTVPRLDTALVDRDVNVRMAPRSRLAAIRYNLSIPPVEKALKDEVPEVGCSAANRLHEFDQPLGNEALTHILAGEYKTEPAEQSTANNSQKSGAGVGTTSSTVAATPLTPTQKFKYFARSSFFPPMPYALSVLSGVFSEATDKDHGRHMTAGDFMADSMTHAARSFAFRVTANFFEKFAFATAFRQDPRYFRSDRKGFARIGYALSRVFITESDSGHNQFNASFFAGGLVAAGISNTWSRPEDRTVSSTMGRFGSHVAYRALSNVVRELFGKR